MSKIIYVPLENLDKRYTIMMDNQLMQEFKKRNIDFVKIKGEELTDKIETGFFLDAIGTNYFKASQLMEIMKMFQSKQINNGDIFFFSDLWFPGIESIKYVTAFTKTNVKITGILHAGSWTKTDDVRTYMKDWAKPIEEGWFKFYDKVFLGSEHHKQEILKRERTKDYYKLLVTGLAFNIEDIYNIAKPLPWNERDDVVVFPHRLHWEKQPKVFDQFMSYCKGYKGIKTMEHDLSKEDYFKLLARSKFAFSSALQENFGYGMFEATVLGCVPIVPNKLAYCEYYPREYRYDNLEEAVDIFNHKQDGKHNIDLSRLNDGIPNMIEYLGVI